MASKQPTLDKNTPTVVLSGLPGQSAAITLLGTGAPKRPFVLHQESSQHMPLSLTPSPSKTHGNYFIEVKLFPSRHYASMDPAASLALLETEHHEFRYLYRVFHVASCGEI